MLSISASPFLTPLLFSALPLPSLYPLVSLLSFNVYGHDYVTTENLVTTNEKKQ